MRTWTSILAGVLSLAAVPALAASCKVKDLPQKFAILPDFIVLEKGEEWRNALTRVLGCELPQPTLPSLASGQKVEPMVMIGKDVFNAKGDNVGVITDVVVDQQSFKVESVVKLKAELGAKEVAIPVAAKIQLTERSLCRIDGVPRRRTLLHFTQIIIPLASQKCYCWTRLCLPSK